MYAGNFLFYAENFLRSKVCLKKQKYARHTKFFKLRVNKALQMSKYNLIDPITMMTNRYSHTFNITLPASKKNHLAHTNIVAYMKLNRTVFSKTMSLV